MKKKLVIALLFSSAFTAIAATDATCTGCKKIDGVWWCASCKIK